MVVDRSLREVTSGVYTTTTKLPKSGIYDVAFLLDSPRITHCFSAEAKPNPDVVTRKPVAFRIEYLNKEKQLGVGENYKLRFKLIDTATSKAKSDLKDVRVLTTLLRHLAETRLRAFDRRRSLRTRHSSSAIRRVSDLCREQVSGRELQTTPLPDAADCAGQRRQHARGREEAIAMNGDDMKHPRSKTLFNLLSLGLLVCAFAFIAAQAQQEASHHGDTASSKRVRQSKQQPQSKVEAHYSCPMHPAVKAKSPGKCPKCGMKLVAVHNDEAASAAGVAPHDADASTVNVAVSRDTARAVENEHPGYRTIGPERTQASFLHRPGQRPYGCHQFHLHDVHDDLSAARRNFRTRAERARRQRRAVHLDQRRSGNGHSRTAQSLGSEVPRCRRLDSRHRK